MRKLSKQQLAAIEAVAKHFSTNWVQGKGPPDAYLEIGGKRVAVEVAALTRQLVGSSKPRLRFDKVVLRLVKTLQANLSAVVPEGSTVILTVTAPILLPAKTAAAIEEQVRGWLTHRSARVERQTTIHGNLIRVRIVKNISNYAQKVLGFVHNPDSNPEVILDLAHALVELIGIAADRHASARFAGQRWLVLAIEDSPTNFELYRQVCSQIMMPIAFKKVLMAHAGGRVEDHVNSIAKNKVGPQP